MMVPAADFGESGFHARVGLDEPRDLLQAAAQFSPGAILRACGGIVGGVVQRLDHSHGGEGVLAGGCHLPVGRVGVHALEDGRCVVAGAKLLHVVHSDGRAVALQRARQAGADGNGAQRGSIGAGRRQGAIQPSVALHPRSARFHKILRIEVGARGIRRAGGFHDGEHLAIPQCLQGLKRWIQPEAAVEIDNRIRQVRRAGRGNANGRAKLVVTLLGKRHHHVQSVGGAALKNRHQDFASDGAGTGHDHRRTAQENPPSQHKTYLL